MCISHSANALEKSRNATIPAMGKEWGRLGSLTFVWQLNKKENTEFKLVYLIRHRFCLAVLAQDTQYNATFPMTKPGYGISERYYQIYILAQSVVAIKYANCISICGAFNKFPDIFVLVFKIVDSWKFSMLLLYVLWDDWPIFMISGSNEQLQ